MIEKKETSNKKKIIRYFLAPFIFVASIIIPLICLVVSPVVWAFALCTILGIVSFPFVYLLKNTGSEINYLGEEMCDVLSNTECVNYNYNFYMFLNYLTCLTFFFWFPFVSVIAYIKIGKILLRNIQLY